MTAFSSSTFFDLHYSLQANWISTLTCRNPCMKSTDIVCGKQYNMVSWGYLKRISYIFTLMYLSFDYRAVILCCKQPGASYKTGDASWMKKSIANCVFVREPKTCTSRYSGSWSCTENNVDRINLGPPGADRQAPGGSHEHCHGRCMGDELPKIVFIKPCHV